MRKTAIFSAVVAGLLAFVAKAETFTATNVVVAPLVDTHWTQNAPYNDYSPKGTTVFTSGWEAGCVAIAAAQELRYWQWPWLHINLILDISFMFRVQFSIFI